MLNAAFACTPSCKSIQSVHLNEIQLTCCVIHTKLAELFIAAMHWEQRKAASRGYVLQEAVTQACMLQNIVE